MDKPMNPLEHAEKMMMAIGAKHNAGEVTPLEALEHTAWSFAAAMREAYEDAAGVAEGNSLVSGSIGPRFDVGWSAANRAGAYAIRKRMEDVLG